MTSQDKYVFAIAASDEVPDLGDLSSFDGHPLEVESRASLSAILARAPKGRLRPRRSHLRIHHRVIDRVAQQGGSVLPFSFGTMAPPEELMSFLEEHQERLTERIELVRGCVETTIKVGAKEGQFYEFMIASDGELAAYRDRIYGPSGGSPTRDEKIELGQRVEAAREALSQRFEAELTRELGEVSRNHEHLGAKGEEQLAQTVFLVETRAKDDFEARLEAVAAEWPEALVVNLSPYLAPYHFANLEVS